MKSVVIPRFFRRPRFAFSTAEVATATQTATAVTSSDKTTEEEQELCGKEIISRHAQ